MKLPPTEELQLIWNPTFQKLQSTHTLLTELSTSNHPINTKNKIPIQFWVNFCLERLYNQRNNLVTLTLLLIEWYLAVRWKTENSQRKRVLEAQHLTTNKLFSTTILCGLDQSTWDRLKQKWMLCLTLVLTGWLYRVLPVLTVKVTFLMLTAQVQRQIQLFRTEHMVQQIWPDTLMKISLVWHKLLLAVFWILSTFQWLINKV
jgi:hypothetical protein